MIHAGEVIVESQGAVRKITFGHPAHNSLPARLLGELAQRILEAGNEPGTACILLASSGDRTFCAGASFDELLSIKTQEDSTRFFQGFAGVILAIRNCGIPVIGRVQGKAVGGGVGLAAACDITFGTQHAGLRLSELAVGIGPFVIGPAVERKIGISAFTQMAFAPEQNYSAEWGLQHGMFSAIYPDILSMDEAIEKYLNQLTSYSMNALRELKRIIWQGTEHWPTLLAERAAISGKLLLEPRTQEILSKIKAK